MEGARAQVLSGATSVPSGHSTDDGRTCEQRGGRRADSRVRAREGADSLRDELGVVLDPAEQRRTARVLPGQAEEVQTWHLGDSALMLDLPAGVEDRQRDERVVEPEARRPDDSRDGDLGAVGEGHRRAPGAGRPWQHVDALSPCPPWTGPDERLPVLHPLTDRRGHGLVHQAGRLQVAEEVPTEDALRKRRLARANREVDLARLGQLRGDLEPGVPTSHDERGARWQAARRPVVAAVQLRHVTAEVSGHHRPERHLKRPGGDHDLVGFVGPFGELDDEAIVAGPHGPDAAVELDRQLEALRVVREVGDDVVAAGVAVGVAGKGQTRQAVVADRREQLQGVPAGPPCGGRFAGRLQDREPAALLSQEVADGQSCLATADDDHVPPRRGSGAGRHGAHAVTSKLNIMPLSGCSAMWQCAIQRPTFVTSSTMSTVSPVRTSTVSLHTRFGSTTPSRARVRNRPAPWMWKGWCIGWSESISLTSRIFTRSPTRKCQSIAWFSASSERSTSFQRMLAGVVSLLTSTMSSSHSMPPASSWLCPWAACSWWSASDRTSRAGMSFMPHCGQRSAVSLVTSGCIGQANPAGAASAMSFIPQLGQRPGSSLTTSGCIGHV